jgi:glycosyltransferase involved in cell wall biosynthesis
MESLPTDTISAIIPSYNRAHKVCHAIHSVLAQSTVPDEIIVVDDGSTDETGKVIREQFGDRVRVIVHEKNQGISAARRTGFQCAKGTWIAYLDSDDSWPVDAIRRLKDVVTCCDHRTVVAFGDMLIFNGSDPDRSHFATTGYLLDGPASPVDSREVVFPVMYPYFQSSLIRRSALQQAKVFEEGLRIGEDSLAFAQLSSCGHFVVIPEVTCLHDRTGDDGLSLHVDEIANPDFPMSRILMIRAFNTDGKGPFRRREYAGWVRAWIRRRQEMGSGITIAEMKDQFRYHLSVKSLCFFAVAIMRSYFWSSQQRKRMLDSI